MTSGLRRSLPACLATVLAALFTPHAPLAADPTPIAMPSHAAFSPDGKRIVFAWRGDIWSASINGGTAMRVARHPGRNMLPRFSPDGRRIFFYSRRTGVWQVYSMSVGGGEAEQITRHSEGSSLEALAPDGSFMVVRGPRDSQGPDSDRLLEIPSDGSGGESMCFDAEGHSASISPNGERILFCRRGEKNYRKGYRGPRASQIWVFDRKNGALTPVVRENIEARWPLWLPDGNSFLFVSERDGTFNLWKGRIGSDEMEQLTGFSSDGIQRPSVSADGKTVVFRRGFDLWRFHPDTGKPPEIIRLTTEESLPDTRFESRTITGTVDADVAPDGHTTIFSAGSDLWMLDGDKVTRLTDTPEREEDPAFLPDGSGFWFLRDDGVQSNYHLARRTDPDRPWSAGNLTTTPATSGPEMKWRLKPSPDGTRIAYVAGNGNLFAADADGSHSALIYKCWDPPTFDWSPDGTWLVVAAKDRNSNRDIYLALGDGSAAPLKLTRNPGFDGTARWSPDGRKIAFLSRRDSAERELFVIGLGTGAPNHIDPQEAAKRPIRIPTRGIEPARLVWSPDSREILFQSARRSNPSLYAVEMKKNGRMRKLASHRGLPMRMDADGTFHWLVKRSPTVFHYAEPDASGRSEGKITIRKIPPTPVTRDRRAHSRLAFRMVWRTLGRRFYDPSLNNLDWPAMLAKYEPAAAASPDWQSFDRVVAMLMGELNASHLTFISKRWPTPPKPPRRDTITRHPGMRFHPGPDDKTLTIATVLPGSPASKITPPLLPGTEVISIDGMSAISSAPLEIIMEGKPNSEIRVVVRDAEGERQLRIPTIRYSDARKLAAQARLAANRRTTLEESKGRAAYIALTGMQKSDITEFEREIYHAAESHDALVLDLRDNEGGTIADRLLSIFCQPRHAITIPRAGPPGYPIDRLGHPVFSKPLVVLINQNSFSNAEVFAHAIKSLHRAPLVGVRTAGGVISAGHDRIIDAGILRVPFRGWFHPESGTDLEMNGATPDITVDLPPTAIAEGKDPQLDAAITAVLKMLDQEKSSPTFTPHYQNGH